MFHVVLKIFNLENSHLNNKFQIPQYIFIYMRHIVVYTKNSGLCKIKISIYQINILPIHSDLN